MNKKKFYLLVLSTTIGVSLMGCNQRYYGNISNSEIVYEEKNSNKTTKYDQAEDISNVKEETNSKELTIYYYDIIDDKLLNKDVFVDSVDKDTILEQLKTLKVLPDNIKVNKLNIVDNTMYLDFNKDFLHQNLGSGPESRMLMAVTNTYMDAFNVDKLILTVEEENYCSGHTDIYEYYRMYEA